MGNTIIVILLIIVETNVRYIHGRRSAQNTTQLVNVSSRQSVSPRLVFPFVVDCLILQHTG